MGTVAASVWAAVRVGGRVVGCWVVGGGEYKAEVERWRASLKRFIEWRDANVGFGGDGGGGGVNEGGGGGRRKRMFV